MKVPRGRWVNLSITIDVRRKLDEIASALGFSSPNDVIAYLVKVYEECRKLDEVYELLKTRFMSFSKPLPVHWAKHQHPQTHHLNQRQVEQVA